YDVYNATWRLLYHYYKHVVYPFHEYLANGNVSSSEGWVFDSIGNAGGEICGSAYRSSPSSLRITTGSGRGAWRQSFYFDAGGVSPTIDFWYRLRGSGALAIKKPDGSAHLFTLGESNGWSRFLRNSTDVFSEAGYYTVSFVACEDSELLVDDASVHVGGYGEWIYQGEVEECPDEVPPDERYEPFYRIEDKKLIGTFEESFANQYPTPPYIKEFKKREKVSYVVDLYKLYYLEGGLVRYKLYRWEKYEVPVVVRREETGAKWVLVESGVEAGVGSRILVESNVPENIVREKYGDPFKYYLVPKVVDGGERIELVCQTPDESLAEKYKNEGYMVNNTKISVGSPIRFEVKVLEAAVENNELNMLGKQNLLKITVANPTDDTLTYQVVLETANERQVEEVQRHDIPASAPGAVEKIYSYPVAEPGSWLITIPPGGAPYQFPFTVWVRREYEGASLKSEDTTYWTGGAVNCNFMIKVLRNGRLVAKYSALDTFQNYDLGMVIARHPFETVGGFLVGAATTACITVLSILVPPASIGLAVFSLGLSTANAIGVYKQTGSLVEALTYSPLGIVLAPLRAFFDPTMDDAARCGIIGALVGTIVGRWVGEKIALDVAMLCMAENLRNNPEIYSRLYGIEKDHGTPLASSAAKSIGKLYPYFDTLDDPEGLVTMILSGMMKSREDALYIAGVLEWASNMGDEFLSQHAGDIMEWLGSPLLRFKLGSLLQLSPEEALLLSQNAGGDFLQMLRMAEFKQALEQLKLQGPDVARIFSWSPEGIEVGVEKGLASKLYPSIQRGVAVEFEFARGDIVFKGFLTYVDDRALDAGEYLVFSLKAGQYSSAVFELLKEDLQVVPGKLPQKAFGFNAFSLSGETLTPDKGSLSMDGSVRLGNGMVLHLDNPGVSLLPSENPLETGEMNRMLLTGGIGGTGVIVSEEGAVKALHQGNYLPAAVTAGALGLELGVLANPSGGELIIPRDSIAAKGIQGFSLLNVAYPGGETYTALYTGGDLQIPLSNYPQGAFVALQPVRVKVVSTIVDRSTLFNQIASVTDIVREILGEKTGEELLKNLLLSDLKDTQALDIANELVRNLEWLKTLSGQKRMELVRSITEYVRRGETAEEAIERVKRESEEYVKNLEKETIEFYNSISDTQLANEVLDLVKHIQERLGPEAARWLLDVLKRVYGEAFASTQGNREYANTKLRSVVENAFKYPESVTQGCALSSAVVTELMEKSVEEAWETLNRVVNYPEGLTIKVRLLKGATNETRTIYIPKKTMHDYLGAEGCIIVIEGKGRTIYRKYNPSISEATRGYRFEVPSWVGQVDEEVEINIRKLDTRSFLRMADEAGLPFRLLVKPDGRLFLFVNGKEIPVSEFSKVEWGGGALNKPYAELAVSDYAGVMHVIKIAYDGDSSPFVGIELAGRAREIYSTRYIEEVKVLEVVYGLKYEEGIKKFTHTIRLSRISNTMIINGSLFEEAVGEGFIPTDLVDQIDWDSETEKGKLGLLIAMAIYGKEGCQDVKIDNSGRNKWNKKDETRYYIFDACGTVNGEFIGSEVKLTTVSMKDIFDKLNDETTIAQILEQMKNWNEIAGECQEPTVKRGAIIAIYVDKDTGHFWFAVRWVSAP
ncbi:MAG: hypothetical protein QXP19_02495, partial [Thermoproteota archaeon]